MSSFLARWVTVGLLGVVVGGCAEEQYEVKLVPPPEGLDGVVAYDLVLLWVTCAQIGEAGGIADRGWVITRTQWVAGQNPPDIGQVEPGRYSLVGIARGDGCGAGFGGCLDIEVDRGGADTLAVQLQAVGGGFGCLPNEICAGGGICTNAPQCDNVTIACDNDGDGYHACLEGQGPPDCDCWDDNGDVHPGAEEHCDGVDNDCNGEDDPVECSGCFERCPEMGPCQRPDCPDGPEGDCVVVDRSDGHDCVGDGGPAFCCDGECIGECAPATTEDQECGVGGTQTRTCGADCTWEDFSACVEPGDCVQDDTRTQPCGNCMLGTQDEVCDAGEWVPDGACVGGGVCAPDATRQMACGDCGQRTDTCSDACVWVNGPCGPDAALAGNCLDPEICCPNGACGEDGTECCGTDVSTCGAQPLCRDWACDTGLCSEVPETAGTDPEDECGAMCCDGTDACVAC